MAKKRNDTLASKEKEKAKVSAFDMEQVLQTTKWAREPTYRFEAGDKVIVGNLVDATVDEVLNDGKMYLIRHKCYDKKSNTTSDSYTCFPWTGVRPIVPAPAPKFTQDCGIKLHYTNRTVESLLHMHLSFGVDFEPEYQRGYVWEDKDRELLLDSIFLGADIGKFVVRRRSAEEWHLDGMSYEIVDGKQRLLTLLDFYENRFPYRGVYYNDLCWEDRHTLKNTNISVAEFDCVDKKQIINVFLLLNRGGRPVSDSVIKKAEHLLNGNRLYKTTVTISCDDGKEKVYSQERYDLAEAKDVHAILNTFVAEKGVAGMLFTVNMIVEADGEYVDSDEADFCCFVDEHGNVCLAMEPEN